MTIYLIKKTEFFPIFDPEKGGKKSNNTIFYIQKLIKKRRKKHWKGSFNRAIDFFPVWLNNEIEEKNR